MRLFSDVENEKSQFLYSIDASFSDAGNIILRDAYNYLEFLPGEKPDKFYLWVRDDKNKRRDNGELFFSLAGCYQRK